MMNKPNGILHEWNKTHAEYPEDMCIHELFEAQVKRTPEATAVVFGSERVSYDELNQRANRLAHHLRKIGVRPEERVGICVERGVEMIVAVLAVLKAGGAYVPLDPEYPEERLQVMRADSGKSAQRIEERFRAMPAPIFGVGVNGDFGVSSFLRFFPMLRSVSALIRYIVRRPSRRTYTSPTSRRTCRCFDTDGCPSSSASAMSVTDRSSPAMNSRM